MDIVFDPVGRHADSKIIVAVPKVTECTKYYN